MTRKALAPELFIRPAIITEEHQYLDEADLKQLGKAALVAGGIGLGAAGVGNLLYNDYQQEQEKQAQIDWHQTHGTMADSMGSASNAQGNLASKFVEKNPEFDGMAYYVYEALRKPEYAKYVQAKSVMGYNYWIVSIPPQVFDQFKKDILLEKERSMASIKLRQEKRARKEEADAKFFADPKNVAVYNFMNKLNEYLIRKKGIFKPMHYWDAMGKMLRYDPEFSQYINGSAGVDIPKDALRQLMIKSEAKRQQLEAENARKYQK